MDEEKPDFYSMCPQGWTVKPPVESRIWGQELSTLELFSVNI